MTALGPGPGALPPLLGRGAEFELAASVRARAGRGEAQLLLVTGEAGIGKTRLVEELGALAPERARLGACVPELGPALAYGPFLAALPDRAGWLLEEADDAAEDPARRRRGFERMLAELTELARPAASPYPDTPSGLDASTGRPDSGPLVLVLEDLHWADMASLLLLSFLAIRLHRQRVLLVGTLREEGLCPTAQTWLAELARRPRVTRMRLKRLDDTAIGALVAHFAAPGTHPDRLAAAAAGAEGNPYYARELAAAGAGLPAALVDAVTVRLAELDPRVRQVVELAAVSGADESGPGEGVSHDLLANVLPLSEPELLDATGRAVAAGLLAAGKEGYSFTRKVIRQIVYTRLLPGDRRRLHRAVASALEDGGGPIRHGEHPGAGAARLAEQWRLAGCADRAADAALIAARTCLAAAQYAEASRLFATMIGLGTRLPEPRAAVLAEAARAAGSAGDPWQAAGYLGAALEAAPAGEAADVRADLWEQLAHRRGQCGDPRASVAAAEEAVRLLETESPSSRRARARATLAGGLLRLGRPDQALSWALTAAEDASRVGAEREYGYALGTVALVAGRRGQLDTGLRMLQRSAAAARRSADFEEILRIAVSQMRLLGAAGRPAEALDTAARARSAAAGLGASAAAMTVLEYEVAATLLRTGHWAEADRVLDEAGHHRVRHEPEDGDVEDARAADVVGARATCEVAAPMLLRLELAVARGEQRQAAVLAERLARLPDEPRLAGTLHACLAEAALLAADPVAALREVRRGLAEVAGAAPAAEEIRLLTLGAWAAADVSRLPGAVRPRDLDVEADAERESGRLRPDLDPRCADTAGSSAGWLTESQRADAKEPSGDWARRSQARDATAGAPAAGFADRARAIAGRHRGEPAVVAYAAWAAAEDARGNGDDDRALWRSVAAAWQAAQQPYREAYARLREAGAAARAGRRDQAARALAACVGLARRLPSPPLLEQAGRLAQRARLDASAAEAEPAGGEPQAPGAAPARARLNLTDREYQVLRLLTNGQSNRQIGRALGISDRTVAVHVSHILGKLGVRNRTEAAAVGTHYALAPALSF